MFSKVSHSFLRDFVDSFHSVTVESGEFLYKCDEAPERMYYFSKGRIELIDSLDKVTNVLELGIHSNFLCCCLSLLFQDNQLKKVVYLVIST